MRTRFLPILLIVLTAIASTACAQALDIDGRKGAQWSPQTPNNDTALNGRYRPWVKANDGADFVLDGVHGHDVIDQKALFIAGSSPDLQKSMGLSHVPSFRSITVRNALFETVHRDQRAVDYHLHMDFIQINGGATPVDLTVENVTIKGIAPGKSTPADPNGDSGVMPLLLKNERFGTIRLTNVHISDVPHPVYIDHTGTGSTDRVIISNCPGLQVVLQGPAHSIGPVTVTESPGCVVVNNASLAGMNPQAQITYDTAPIAAPAPAPAPTPPVVAPATPAAETKDQTIARIAATNAALMSKVSELTDSVNQQAAQLASWRKWLELAPKD